MQSSSFIVEADSADDAKKYALKELTWVAPVGDADEYRCVVHSNMALPPKPTDDEGYYQVLTDILNSIEADGFHDSPPNLLKLWYGISKLEAMRLYNAWSILKEQRLRQVLSPKSINDKSSESNER
jgi:hypothetical protein